MADKIVKSAGRISPTPMGDYDDTTTYRRLDWIQYGGTSYICKKNDTCGINPSDTNHWQKIINLDFLNVAFEEANERQQINSGDNLSTILGKIKKWFVDLKPVAFSGNYADLDGTPDLSVYASESDMVSTKESIQDLKQATDVVIDPYTNSTNVSFSVPSGNNVLPTAEGSRYSLRSAIEESTQGISEEVIKKADKTSLHKVASTGKYSDLSDKLTLTNSLLATIPGTALDAMQGKALIDKISHAESAYSRGTIEKLTDINQINDKYRYWRIYTIDNDYSTQIGIGWNSGDWHALVLSYNGDGTNFNYGNIILSSPRIDREFYYIQVWNGVAHAVMYGDHKGTIDYLNNWIWTSGSGISISGSQVTMCLGVINSRGIYQKDSEICKIPIEYAPRIWTIVPALIDEKVSCGLKIGTDGIIKNNTEFDGHYVLVNASWNK